MLRSIRYGEADRILHLYTAERGRVNAIAKGSRRPKSRFGGRLEPFFRLDLMLHEGRSDLCTVTGASTLDGYPRLRSDGAAPRRRRARLRRGPAAARLGRAEPPRLQPALPLPGAARRRARGPRRSGAARPPRRRARLPAEAGAGGRLLARARLLRALRRARGDRRVLGRRRRSRLQLLRGRRLPALARRARVHGRRARPARSPSCRRRRSGRSGRSSARSATRSPITLTSTSARSPKARDLESPGWMKRSRPPRSMRMRSPTASGPRRPSSSGSGRRARIRRVRREPEPDSPVRTPFQRDRDRIAHSKAFRRLKHKTQVFIAPEGDHYRTRLTHTLETCFIARTVARALGLNEDLTEAIGLGHDLGHPPFGHIGEEALDAALKERGGDGFRHNEHSLRVVERLERGGSGPQPDRAGPRRDPQPHRLAQAGDARGPGRPARRPRRLHQPRHRRRGPRRA